MDYSNKNCIFLNNWNLFQINIKFKNVSFLNGKNKCAKEDGN